ncbi:lipid droplet assembly factor 1 [Rana temporaria]|uniref:lipid droplet assembly factor 1 n=1 Tax=Rana temporaria TaxID=8407 RepID=UPI001AACF65A|nr:lipid droplet assembly factor 1 [Rana temporaria]
MTSSESFYAEKMQELQKQLNSVKKAINTNSKVIAFMNSPFGQYLEERPYISLSLLVFVALSAVPCGLFLIMIVGTAVIACLGVIIIEGIVVAVGGVTLLCVLCGLVILSFGVSGVLSVSYFAISSILNYMHKARLSRNDSHQSRLGSTVAEERPPVNASKDSTHDK